MTRRLRPTVGLGLRHFVAIGGLALLAAVTAVQIAAAQEPGDPQDALRRGNRAFREGRLDEALDLYSAGYRPGHRLLAYNAGTTAHHLDRLPLALLWYRRAAREGDDDVWLRSNRALVREQLAAPRHAPPGPWELLTRLAPWLSLLGVTTAWAAWLVARRRTAPRPRHLPEGLLVLAGLLVATGWVLPRRAPHPLVLLAPCDDSEGVLPAGTETWGRPAADHPDTYIVATPEGGYRCPATGVGEVDVLASPE